VSSAGTVRAALRGSLPPRYVEEFWRRPYEAVVQRSLAPGQRILDLGSGAAPAIPPDRRPAGVTYEGLDISGAELEKAPPGSYDARHVADAVHHLPELDGRYDLIVSFQVFEHIRPLAAAVENIRRYLRPGGLLVSQFSGTFSLFGLLNRIVPQRLAVWGMKHLMYRDPDSVFPAHYDRCWDSALRRMFAPWAEVEIEPLYTGAGYLAFARPLQALYVGAEEQWARRDARNLAAYYIVTARR
jgi:SAM-dependent methyltransferase